MTFLLLPLLLTTALAATCPQVISEGCPPSTNCTSTVCGTSARCLAWENQTQTAVNCCSYLCSGAAAPTCFAKWFDNIGNALNCDPCAGANCQNRTSVEASCTAQYGANGYNLIQPDPSVRRCCFTCTQKPFSCPTQISERCPPSASCASSVCSNNARCPAWENQPSITPNCCSYACGNGTTGGNSTTCFAKWFDKSGNALNCDPCAGASCANRTTIEANCAAQYGANGYTIVQPDSSVRRCCLTCTQKPFSCPTQISESCPPSSSCASSVCSANARCPAWENQPSITPNCCSYACSSSGTSGGTNSTCFAKWFDKSGNALNCDPCAGASCANRTTIEANCAAQYGANGYTIVQPDSSVRRCCLTCTQKAFSCPTQISEGCPPSSSCGSSVCSANARCLAWENQTFTPNCCSYQCSGAAAPTCFAKWFDKSGNALNCDPCAGATGTCTNRTAVEANCATDYGVDGYDLVLPDPSVRRCCYTCTQKPVTSTCPKVISEGCAPSATCAASVCSNNARCPAWENDPSTTPNCCSYTCGTSSNSTCFAKWFDKIGNALNCDRCAGALCDDRTTVEKACTARYGANGYKLIAPDSSIPRCCFKCEQVVDDSTTAAVTGGEEQTTTAATGDIPDTTGGDFSTSGASTTTTTRSSDEEKSGASAISDDDKTDATGANAIGVSATAIVIVIASIMMN
jgi:hypothetical protein